MRTNVRRLLVGVFALHGALHLIGAPGALWVLSAVLVLVSAVLLALRPRVWWMVGIPAAVVSEVTIIRGWSEAWAGTIVNIILLAAAVHGAIAEGPWGLRSQYRNQTDAATTAAHRTLTEQDLADLPPLLAHYLRRTGALHLAVRTGFRATIEGRIRAGADRPWMRFRGEQVNTFRPEMTRTFFIDATMHGLPVDVLHRYADGDATMDTRAMSLVPVVHADGPDLDRAETVTVFNDMCVMAPEALVDAPVVWTELDDHRLLGSFTVGAHTVDAELVFDDDGDLVDFISDDRLRASDDGRVLTPQRWSTPLGGWRGFGWRRLPGHGEARWHAPAPEGEFAYLEFEIDALEDLVAGVTTPPTHTNLPSPTRTGLVGDGMFAGRQEVGVN